MTTAPSPLAQLRAAKWGPVALRAGVTLGTLGALAWWLPLGTLVDAIGALPAWMWWATLAGFGAGHVVCALKWRWLLQASGVSPGVVEALRAHAAGLFANLCLPSIVGGDVLRAGMVIRHHGRAEAVALGSATDRILDTLGLLAIAALGGLLIPTELSEQTRGALLAVSAILIGAVLGAIAVLALLPRIPRERLPDALTPIAARLSAAAGAIAARPAVAGACLLLSIAVQTSFVALNAALGAAIGLSLPFAVWMLAWPLAKLIALAPVSLGGIGVREVALASLLAPFGTPAALAVAESLLWESLLVALGLLAGIGAFWLGRGPETSTPAAAQGHA